MWDSILKVLRERVAEGVDVRVIYDDLGCLLTLPVGYQKTLRSYGIQCEIFNRFHPLLTTLQNNRDHRKIAVIDGKIAYTGGINLADEYINEKLRFGHWRDCAVRLQGAAAESFTAMFLQTWHLLSKTREPLRDLIADRDTSTPSDGWVQPYADSPMDKIHTGERIYMHAISRSQKSLYITTPYMTVVEEMIAALKWCAQSGVDVRIFTPGIPDKKVVFFTTRSYYRELLSAGVKIYEYTPGFIHSKIVVSDDDFCMIGSTNMDFRSLYLNYECGACFYGSKMIADVKNDILNLQNDCREITEADCKSNLFIKFLQNICRMFAPIM
jgi:cardiolipin synthase